MSEIQLRDWEKTLREDPSDPKFHEGCSDACEYKQPEHLAVVAAKAEHRPEPKPSRASLAFAWVRGVVGGFLGAVLKRGPVVVVKDERLGTIVFEDGVGRVAEPIQEGSPYRRAGLRRLTAEEAAEVALRAAERSRRWARFMLGLTVANVLLQLLRIIFG